MALLTIHLSYPLAFLAGLASFLSPCVFPLVPAYAAYLGGRAAEPELATAAEGPGAATLTRRRDGPPLLANGVAFVIGFSAVFMTLFYVLTAINSTLFTQHRHAFSVAAGVIVLVLALQTLGVLRLGALMRERRIHLVPTTVGLVPSFLLGVSFAAGWTPCIGPQLAAILAVAQQGDFTGLPVMICYCLGLAVPFLLVAALADRLQGPIRALNRHLGAVNLVAGLLLVVFGMLLVLDKFTFFNQYAAQPPFDL